jgi:hypothetical protein
MMLTAHDPRGEGLMCSMLTIISGGNAKFLHIVSGFFIAIIIDQVLY